MDEQIIKLICPYCGKENDRSIPARGDSREISNGDISFCIGCGECSEFKDGQLFKINISSLSTENIEEINNLHSSWEEVVKNKLS